MEYHLYATKLRTIDLNEQEKLVQDHTLDRAVRTSIDCSFDRPHEVSQGWIGGQCCAQELESQLLIRVNCPVEVDAAPSQPVLAG